MVKIILFGLVKFYGNRLKLGSNLTCMPIKHKYQIYSLMKQVLDDAKIIIFEYQNLKLLSNF